MLHDLNPELSLRSWRKSYIFFFFEACSGGSKRNYNSEITRRFHFRFLLILPNHNFTHSNLKISSFVIFIKDKKTEISFWFGLDFSFCFTSISIGLEFFFMQSLVCVIVAQIECFEWYWTLTLIVSQLFSFLFDQ